MVAPPKPRPIIDTFECPWCHTTNLDWDRECEIWVCLSCGRRPGLWNKPGWGNKNNDPGVGYMAGYTASSRGNSGNISRIPPRRDEAEVKPKPPEQLVEPPKPQRGSRAPTVQRWTHFMTWGVAERPQECQWPGCPKQHAGRKIHCQRHDRSFCEAFGESHVTWKHMQLWDRGGEVVIEWAFDRINARQDNFCIRVLSVEIPPNSPRYTGGRSAWKTVKRRFRADMAYPVLDLHDGINEALKSQLEAKAV